MKRIIVRLLLVLLVTFLLVEAILWIFKPQGHEPIISEAYRQDIPGLKEEVLYEKNGLGLRSLSIQKRKKPQGAVRVICLGLSTTEQATQNTADMWSSLLETRLRDSFANYPGGPVDVQVGTYAKGGHKMHDIMRWEHHYLRELEPDVVITLFGINSLATDQNLRQVGYGWDHTKREIEKGRDLWPDHLARYSQTARYVRAITESKERRAFAEATDGYNFDLRGLAQKQVYWKTPIISDPGDDPARVGLFRQRTDALLDSVLEKGVRPVVLAQPLLLHSGMDYRQEGEQIRLAKPPASQAEADQRKAELDSIWFFLNNGSSFARLLPGDFRKEMGRFNQQQREAAESRGVPYVPLDDIIPANRDNFFDDCHFTDLGSQRVADAIFPVVRTEVEKVLSGRTMTSAE